MLMGIRTVSTAAMSLMGMSEVLFRDGGWTPPWNLDDPNTIDLSTCDYSAFIRAYPQTDVLYHIRPLARRTENPLSSRQNAPWPGRMASYVMLSSRSKDAFSA